MLIPKTEAEILAALQHGSLEETEIFDAKRELPGKNKNFDLAKDVAAMANNGGVLIYGIGEDENNRLTQPAPFELSGQIDRITSIIRTSIEEPPDFHAYPVYSTEDPSKGYIVVQVPPSSRAPHMVVGKGDHRYYGRIGSQSVPLSEGEVARLYQRRASIDVDINADLESEVSNYRTFQDDTHIFMHVVIRPTFPVNNILQRLTTDEYKEVSLLARLAHSLVGPNSFVKEYHPNFTYLSEYEYTVGGVIVRSKLVNDIGDLLSINVQENGMAFLFCARAGGILVNQELLFYPAVAFGNLVHYFRLMGLVYSLVNYVGMLKVGLYITNLKGTKAHIPGRGNMIRRILHIFPEEHYRRVMIASALTLEANAAKDALNLLEPLAKVYTQGQFDLFSPYKNP